MPLRGIRGSRLQWLVKGTEKHAQYGFQERVKSACEYNIKPKRGFVWLIACPYILSRTKKSFSKKIFVRYVPLSHKPEQRSCTLCTYWKTEKTDYFPTIQIFDIGSVESRPTPWTASPHICTVWPLVLVYPITPICRRSCLSLQYCMPLTNSFLYVSGLSIR